jgi:hypothetical protein
MGLSASVGCARARIEDGRYLSAKGYRVAVPPAGWTVVAGAPADLALRRESPRAQMLVNASCDGPERGRSSAILTRHLLMGLGRRSPVVKDEVAIGGRVAAHVVLEGQAPGERDAVRVEAYVIRGERCVYDFLYAAPAGSFEAWRGDFRRVVESFTAE